MLWLTGKFFMEVSRDYKLTGNIAIMWVEKNGVLGLVTNPKNVVEAVEVFIGYLILKIFHNKSIKFKKLRVITTILLIITLLIFLVATVDSMFPYLPNNGHPLP